MNASCPHCEAPLETPLHCAACGRLLAPEQPPGPFEVLGLEPAWPVDGAALKRTLLSLQRAMHPDFFATADRATRELADRNTAELNAAFETVSDDFRRADHLVRSLGGPDENAERQMPQAFLMEVMEWNEALEEARGSAPGSPARAAAEALREPLREQRAAAMARVGELLTPLPPPEDAALTEARRHMNAVRYVQRALAQIEELRLEGTPSG
jgi:DnaJ-domain-containing protein 1